MSIWLIINHRAVTAETKYVVFGNRAKAIAYAQSLGFQGDWSEQPGFEINYRRGSIELTIVRLESR